MLLNCGSSKKISFETYTFMSKSNRERFTISVPRDFKSTEANLQNNILKKWKYKNEEFIYISLDISFSNSPNLDNWIKCSDAQKGIKCIEGIDENGNYWKEIISNNLVIGYRDVNPKRKKEFDDSLLSLNKL